MMIIAHIAGWLRLLIVAAAAFYLWRSALFPKGDDPRGALDRAVRLLGAVLLSSVTIFFYDLARF